MAAGWGTTSIAASIINVFTSVVLKFYCVKSHNSPGVAQTDRHTDMRPAGQVVNLIINNIVTSHMGPGI